MKGTEKKRSPSINQTKRFPRSERRDSKLQQENANKNLKAKETDVKALSTKQGSRVSINDSKTGTVTSEVYEEIAIHYVDDICRSEEASQNKLNGHCNDLEKEPQEARGESDSETINDSLSSHGDSQIPEDEKVEIISLVPKRLPNVRPTNNLEIKASPNTPKKSAKPNRGIYEVTAKNLSDYNSKNMKVHPNPSSDSSEGIDYKPLEEVKEIDIADEAASNGVQIGGSDDETVNNEEKLKHEDNAALNKKIEEMEMRIGKLEEELREVAALEISLYSVVPEHSNSAHKVHAPARRLSRLYIHACKHSSQEKRATIARSTVSGLVLIAKSCGNDVPMLTFWLSNTIVLREIVTQAFGNSCQSSSLTRMFESNGIGKRSEGKYSSPKWKYNSLTRQPSKHVSVEFIDDWQETRTFTTALEKIESWIFSRIVESIWWQTLTPNMQSPAVDMSKSKATGKLLGPALGDQKQGSFSVNLWKNAFEDAFKRLCPIRARGHKCGCLPVLARMVMEHCVARLDVAMFNAILRESAHEIPTDPVSDPIVDPKVLPIPAGDLSFGSGAQLKNAVGNWSRWLTDLFGTNVNDDQHRNENDNSNRRSGVTKLKCFNLLNSLSDLLMLPKDMLMDRSIRTEVCPSITLPLLKRVLCNFTPDEFCPDPVPGTVLEAVNAECIVERRVLGETASSFPYRAAPIMYKPPHSYFATNASLIQRKGYTSDEELEELVFPLTSIIEKSTSSPPIMANGSRNENGNNGERKEQKAYVGANVRYELLREVWLA